MQSHQFSKVFAIDTDKTFKEDEFEKALADWIVAFVQHYPHLIERKIENGLEYYIFRFAV
jgi:hypothetical protein